MYWMGVHTAWLQLANPIERYVCVADAPLSQIALTNARVILLYLSATLVDVAVMLEVPPCR